MVVHLTSPGGRYDTTYLRNYAVLHIKDELARLPGVGQAMLFGAGDYAMRIWLDPDKVASHQLTAGDVVNAIREQNIQVSAGQIGAPPMPQKNDFLVSVNARGRLVTEQEFGNIVLKVDDGGRITHLSDVARIELGPSEYALRALLDNEQAVAIPIFQSPGSNALEMSKVVRERMTELAKQFPEGVKWSVVYDTTAFVHDSINSVIHTLFEAIVLVVLVVILFLQTWRASIIPLIAVPVSVVGTFAVLYVLGFSINTLTLFGLVLAIGIVVDDAIVVVENIERNIEEGLTPLAAAHQAMREVSGPIIAIAVVLCSVFVPMAFLSGVTGQFFRQFAVTIAISTVISAINSLTLSPALSAVLLKTRGSRPDVLSRWMESGLGWLFRPFNRGFASASHRYRGAVSGSLHRRGVVFLVYVVLLGSTMLLFKQVPGGFIPTQDKMYLIGAVRMPEGSSLDATDAMARKIGAIAMKTEGVDHAVGFPGFNPLQRTNSPNTAAVFFTLKPFDQRHRTAAEIAAELNGKFSQLQEGMAFAIMPPPIFGLGTGSGYSLYIQDRAGLGYGALDQARAAFAGRLAHTPGFGFPISSYQANTPQLDAVVDRTKAKIQGVNLDDLFQTLQVYLGSAYVNDFNRLGRTFKVMVQADAPFRDDESDIGQLKTRNSAGEMVPIGSLVKLEPTFGPDPVIRYNGYPAADLIGETNPRMVSSAQAIQTIDQLAPAVLPPGMQMEWTDLSYQQVTQGHAAVIVFPLAVLLAFLALAALYESWVMPLAVIMIVPMCLLAALTGVKLIGGDNNVFVQVGLVVLMGLACKNAILIVEFARELEHHGHSPVQAALEACRLRLRPIVMTSIAFIAGVVPLILSHGAGAEVRHIMGVTVFSGMIGVTLFGLFLTPVFYVGLRMLSQRRQAAKGQPALIGEPETGGA